MIHVSTERSMTKNKGTDENSLTTAQASASSCAAPASTTLGAAPFPFRGGCDSTELNDKAAAPISSVPADSAVRQRALDPARSFIVQAPAGSGKTELLMQRFLTVLALVDEPESVLAITFTRKASSEMRNRILQALEDAQQPAPAGVREHKLQTRKLALNVLERDRQRGWELLKNPSRLQVRTVDSFCDSLARQLPLVGRLGAAGDIAPDARPLYDEAARRTVLMLGDPDERLAAAMAQILVHLDNDLRKAQELIIGMLEKREQWLRLIGRADSLSPHDLADHRAKLEKALADAIRYELGLLREAVEATVPAQMRAELFALMRYAASNRDALGVLTDIVDFPGTEPEDVPQWIAIDRFFFKTDRCVRENVDARNGFPITDRALKQRCIDLLGELAGDQRFTGRVCELFGRLAVLPPPRYTEQQWELIKALFAILPRAVANLKVIFSEQGSTDFSEIAQAAARALGTPDAPTDLSLALGSRIQHLLVDEFQDTSVVQIELLKSLMASWEPGGGNTIFVVGDPMQSIYGFREAEVVLFGRTRQHGIAEHALESLELTVNFRSQANLIEWFNQSFPHILTEDNDVTGAVKYAPAEANFCVGTGLCPVPDGSKARPITAQDTCPVEVHAFTAKDYPAEGAKVAGLVQQALAEDDHGSVAILVRARGHLAEIVKALRWRNIPFRAVNIDALAERQAVMDVNSLTHALLHLGDRTSWIAVLRAPWCGLDLHDLYALCREDRWSTIWDLLQQRRDQLSQAGRARASRILPVFADAFASRGRLPLRQWVESVWVSLGGPASVRAGADGDSDLRDIEAYFDLLQRCEVAGGLPDSATFDRMLNDLYSPANTADGIRVEIMTVHTAKGLEYDTVIVPGLGRKTRGDEKRLLYWRERILNGEPRLLLAPMEPVGVNSSESGTIEGYLRQIEKDRAVEEEKRLLYVAATRARRKLHLLGHIAAPGEQPDSNSLLSILFKAPSVEDAFTTAQSQALGCAEHPARRAVGSDAALEPPTVQEATAPGPQMLRRLPANWQPPQPPEPLHWKHSDTDISRPLDTPHTFQWVGETLRRVGTVAHSFLQQIGRDGLAHWNESTLSKRTDAIRAALLAAGVSPVSLDAAVTKVMQALTNTIADPQGRWILEAHDQARSEFEISGVIDGEVRKLKIDRTFVVNGERWIIDYKLTDIEGGSREKFLADQIEKYRGELELYRSVMSVLDPRPIRCALYFPLLGEMREIRTP
jgi:ATP-dependent helicase/nuclease subunit A